MKFRKLEIAIPQIITAQDYHEFSEYESFLVDLGIINVKFTELGVFDGEYHAILHKEGDSKLEAFQTMLKEFEELSENKEPFDSQEVLNKYYEK